MDNYKTGVANFKFIFKYLEIEDGIFFVSKYFKGFLSMIY